MSGPWDGYSFTNDEGRGKWYVPRSKNGDLVHAFPVWVDEIVQHDETGKKFGFQTGSSAPIEMQYAEELTAENVTKVYPLESLNEELQEKYKHQYAEIERQRVAKQKSNFELVKKFLTENPGATEDDMVMFRMQNSIHMNIDEFKTLQSNIQHELKEQQKPSDPVQKRVEKPLEDKPVEKPQSNPKKQKPDEQVSSNMEAHTRKVDEHSKPEVRQTAEDMQEQRKSNQINKDIQHETSKAESEHVAYQDEKKQRITNSDISKENVKIEGKKILDANAEVRRVNNTFGKMKVAGVIGLTAFGVASVLDVQKELREAKQVERMKNVQEENIYEKQKEERKTMSQFGYGNVDFGQMAIDMFDQRIGHYKMGNSKFQ